MVTVEAIGDALHQPGWTAGQAHGPPLLLRHDGLSYILFFLAELAPLIIAHAGKCAAVEVTHQAVPVFPFIAVDIERLPTILHFLVLRIHVGAGRCRDLSLRFSLGNGLGTRVHDRSRQRGSGRADFNWHTLRPTSPHQPPTLSL